MSDNLEKACHDLTERGYAILPGVFDQQTIDRLRSAYWTSYEICRTFQERYETTADQSNTVHHVLFLDSVFVDVLERDDVMTPTFSFFGTDKVTLNSIGGNNNTGVRNYASNIHRDVRFHTLEPFMLNTIIAVSALSEEVGATEILLNSVSLREAPSEEVFKKEAISVQCPPGSMVYFDSRLWHRAGARTKDVKERIIFTPIFTRPFIKPGFDYVGQLKERGPEQYSPRIRQLAGYYSDVPRTHDDWYNYDHHRFYHKDQDHW